jgi:cytochrome P450
LKFLSERFKKDGDTPELFGKLQREYGPDGVFLCAFKWIALTSQPRYVASDDSDVHGLRYYQILASVLTVDEDVAYKAQTTDNLPKALEVYRKLKPLLGPQSILTLEGDHWYKLRKMFNPAFSQGHLETLVPGIIEETLIFVKLLNDTARGGDVLLMLNALTVNSINFLG